MEDKIVKLETILKKVHPFYDVNKKVDKAKTNYCEVVLKFRSGPEIQAFIDSLVH